MTTEVENVKNTVLTYDFKNIKDVVNEALKSGADANTILQDGMVSAMSEVGEGFKENRIFMPQMLVAAKTMQSGLDVLKPLLKGDGSAANAGKAIVGSVQGDVHDIGKNIVSIMLEGTGMEVIDLGTDVPDATFIETLKENPDARFVAASSSMTTTRDSLRAVVNDVKTSEYKDGVVVMVGGASMNQLFADEIGADIYTDDAASAAERATQILDGEDVAAVCKASREDAESAVDRYKAQDVPAADVATSSVFKRHEMEAPIGAVGHGETKPLTIEENFDETLKHEKGCPDRYVDQYGFFDIVFDPVFDNSFGFGAFMAGQSEYVDGWGVLNITPPGAGGSHPVNDAEHTRIKDITKWQDQIMYPTVKYDRNVWTPYKEQAQKIRDSGKYVGVMMAQGLYERVHYQMGMQEALMAFYEHPEEMHELIDFITEWEISSITENMENLHADVLFHHDDWGTAINSFLDPQTHREFFCEPYKKIYRHFKDMGGKYVIHHSDSYAANLVPIMIDAGIDVWQGAVDANNIPQLIDEYGDRIVFMGGIDDAVLDVPDWSAAAVSKYVEQKCDENGVVSYIPCLTRGLGMSIYPGVYDAVSKTIDEVSKRKF